MFTRLLPAIMPIVMTTRKRAKTRAVSEELDGDVAYVKRSKTTGRPTRTKAGCKPLPKDFIDPAKVIEDDSASDYEEEQEKGTRKRSWSIRKRRTSPPRALPPAEPLDDVSVTNSLDTPSSPSATPQELSLTFHVPPGKSIPSPFHMMSYILKNFVLSGHTGPFVVKLDLGSMLPRSPSSSTSFGMPSESLSK